MLGKVELSNNSGYGDLEIEKLKKKAGYNDQTRKQERKGSVENHVVKFVGCNVDSTFYRYWSF